MTLRLRLICVVVVALTTVAVAGPAPKVPAKQAATTTSVQPEQPASSSKRRIVGILDVRVQGVHKEIAAQFQDDLEKQLDSRAYWLAPRTRMFEMLAHSTRWTDGCLVGDCLNEVRTQTGAEIVLLAAITGSGTSFGHVITLMRTDTGGVLSQDMSRCDVCTVEEALSSATQAAVTLLTALPETLPDETSDVPNTSVADTLNTERVKLKRSYRRIGIVTTLLGLAVAGTGAALYVTKDRPSYALATAAAGGGLMLGGVIAISF